MTKLDGRVARLQTSDPTEASDILERFFYPNRLVAAPGDFAMDLRLARVGALTTSVAGFDNETKVSVDGLDVAYHVIVGLNGAIESRCGSASMIATRESAAVFRPVGEASVRGWREGNAPMLGIKIDRQALEREARSMIGRDVRGHIRFQPQMDLRTGPGAQWLRLASWTAATMVGTAVRGRPSEPVWHPLLAARLSDAVLAGLLLGCDNQFSDLLWQSARRPRPALIQRAIGIIEERAHEPLTVTGIAAEVGVSVRSLQEGFNRHVGASPGQYLTTVRMERAREQLRAGDPMVMSASAVAAAWGFGNYGRFAAKYHERYGETPATTLHADP